MSNVLILAEVENGKIKKSAAELLNIGSQLASQVGGQVEAVLIGSAVAAMANELASLGAKKVYVVENAQLEKYNTIAYAKALSAAVNQAKPGIVLSSASPLGKDLLPRVAGKLGAGLASDVTDLKIEGGKLVASKPIYSGKALVDVKFNSDMQFASIRPNSFGGASAQAGSSAETITVAVDLGELRAPMKELLQGKSDRPDLTEAEIIVSGGRSMKSADNFKILFEMADLLGASVGASRAAVDSGYAPHDMQVGQTGKVVNPKLYMAFGISGAIQHLAGMRNSKVIVAVNKDPEAPIFTKADYGIVGDLFEAVPKITAELKKIL